MSDRGMVRTDVSACQSLAYRAYNVVSDDVSDYSKVFVC